LDKAYGQFPNPDLQGNSSAFPQVFVCAKTPFTQNFSPSRPVLRHLMFYIIEIAQQTFFPLMERKRLPVSALCNDTFQLLFFSQIIKGCSTVFNISCASKAW
jgi:hypothetical protein